jgi:hypothetical protein
LVGILKTVESAETNLMSKLSYFESVEVDSKMGNFNNGTLISTPGLTNPVLKLNLVGSEIPKGLCSTTEIL